MKEKNKDNKTHFIKIFIINLTKLEKLKRMKKKL